MQRAAFFTVSEKKLIKIDLAGFVAKIFEPGDEAQKMRRFHVSVQGGVAFPFLDDGDDQRV